jgi:Uncharacterized conserved protein
MKLKQIYDLFIKEGMEADPRGMAVAELDLLKRKEEYDALSPEKKAVYDIDSLTNPYYDSRIIYGNPDTEVKTVMVGIDVETPEILLAGQLINSGKKVDLLIGHHPEGYAYSTFYNVIGMQTDILHGQGIPVNITEKLVASRIKDVKRSIMPQNNDRVSDAAKLMNIPLMTAHTVADNHVASFLQRSIDELKPRYLKDIMSFLNELPEYKYSSKAGLPPFILLGGDNSRCGKVFVDMTGGTEGPVESLEKLAAAGIGTIVGMHMSEKCYKEAEKQNLNVIIAGHISSDNLGLNLLFDKLEKKLESLEFIECSGFRRFKRTAV